LKKGIHYDEATLGPFAPAPPPGRKKGGWKTHNDKMAKNNEENLQQEMDPLLLKPKTKKRRLNN
jgi:hypothetical protein